MSNAALTASLQSLIEQLTRLPGIGPRSAERIAFHLLKCERAEALALAEAISATRTGIRPCSKCFNLAEGELCAICANPRRDHSRVLVVEQPKDLISFEGAGLYNGLYHVLMGRLAPLEGVEPGDLTIDALVQRAKTPEVSEVILATNPNLEGDATALHIVTLLRDVDVRVTRLARGIAPGSSIEFANKAMLDEALRGRGAF
jgi:recombination protein RecR